MRSAEGRMKEMRGALPLASLLSVIGLSFLFRWFSDAVRQADFVFGNRERRFHPVPGCRIGLIGYALSLCRDGSESASALNPEFPFRLPVSENAGAFRCSNWRPCAELRFRGELCLPGRVFAMGFPCKPARRHEPRLPLPGRRIRAGSGRRGLDRNTLRIDSHRLGQCFSHGGDVRLYLRALQAKRAIDVAYAVAFVAEHSTVCRSRIRLSIPLNRSEVSGK